MSRERAARTAAEIDRVVIGVHRAIDEPAKERVRSAVQSASLDSIAYVADLGVFLLQGALTDDVVTARHRYSVGPAIASIADLRERQLIDPGGRPVQSLADLLAEVETVRLSTAARLWEASRHLEALATGAAEMLRGAKGSLAEPYRALHEPTATIPVLWHRLVGLRYARADAHGAAWKSAGFTGEEMVDLTAAWRGDPVETPQESLVERGMVHSSGVITDEGVRTRTAIEADTNRASEPVYQALAGERWAGWMAAMAELPPSSG